MRRVDDLDRFYRIVELLCCKLDGYRYLCECSSSSGCPTRGMYLFFEDGEYRKDGKTLRVVRVGTHAITSKSRTKLWSRLRSHKGTIRGSGAGGGNHRGSIFRKRVGEAMLHSGSYPAKIAETWGVDDNAPKEVRMSEFPLEQDVSRFIGQMPFLWLDVPDAPSPHSDRAYLERNCIALLSNIGKPSIDPPSRRWLGLKSSEITVRKSGLWNTNHVEDSYENAFLDKLEKYVSMQS